MSYRTLDAARQPRASRGGWRLATALVLLLVLIWFAPTIVARTSLKNDLIKWATPDLKEEIVIGSARLAWLSPIALRNIEAINENGERILSIAKVDTTKSLLALFLDRTNLGSIRVERPELDVIVGEYSSNVEKTLRHFESSVDNTTDKSRKLQVHIAVKDGRLVITDETSQRQWRADHLNIDFEWLPGTSPGFELSGSGNLTNDQQQPGTVTAETDGRRVHIQLANAPLDMVEPFLHHRTPDARINGTVSGNMTFHTGETTQHAQNRLWTSVHLSVDVNKARVTSPEYLGSDEFYLEKVEIRGDLRVSEQQVAIDQLNLDTDFAGIVAQGTWKTDELSKGGWSQFFAQRDCSVNATVDLAKLAQLLPDTLHVREGTYVEAGHINIRFANSINNSIRTWYGEVETTNLVGRTATGRQLAWQQPLMVVFHAYDADDHVVIERFVCHSDFLVIEGKGQLESAEFSARCDLNQLVQPLGQFVDLDRWQLSGNAEAHLDWRCRRGEPFTVQGRAQVDHFEFLIPVDDSLADNSNTTRPWVERQLNINVAATGSTGDHGLERIDRASFRLLAGGDELVASLTQPVDTTDDTAAWPIDFTVSGNLRSWSSRIRPWYDLSQWDVHGHISGNAQVQWNEDLVQLTASKLELESVVATNDRWNIDESKVILEVDGRLDSETRILTEASAIFRCTSVSMKVDDVHVDFPEDGTPAAQGNIKYRGDLSRISRWFTPRGERPTQRLTGQLNGNVQLAHQGDATVARWNAVIGDLTIERNPDILGVSVMQPVSHNNTWETVWSEKELRMTGQGTLDQESESFQLEDLQVQSQLVAMTATGQIQDVMEQREADISGSVHYDMHHIVQSLRGYLGPGVEILGQKQSPFNLRGSLKTSDSRRTTSAIPHTVVVDATFSWDAGSAYGLTLGDAEMHAQLAKQIVSFTPIKVQVNDGHLRCTPQLTFQQNSPMLIIQPGTLLDRVSITREMCSEWLKYVAPLLADATRIDGQMSVSLDHARVPIENSNESDVLGMATIHSGSVRPGPLAEPFINVVRTIRRVARRGPLSGIDSNDPRITTSEQQVTFHLIDGRVYHRNMRVQLGDMPIHTFGSVGLDETLDIVAELQIPDTWIREDSILSSWKGKVIQLPIRGTLDDPDIDRSAIADITTDLIAEPVQRIIDQGILRGLDRLLDREQNRD